MSGNIGCGVRGTFSWAGLARMIVTCVRSKPTAAGCGDRRRGSEDLQKGGGTCVGCLWTGCEMAPPPTLSPVFSAVAAPLRVDKKRGRALGERGWEGQVGGWGK